MIDKLYFMPNLLELSTPIRDFYLFSINPEAKDLDYCDRLFIEDDHETVIVNNQKITYKSVIAIDIAKKSKSIGTIEVIGCPNKVYYDVSFPQSKFLSIELGLTITTTQKLQNQTTTHCKLSVEVFSDAIVINIGEKSINGPYYLIHEKNKIGFLIDDNLVIHSIVILNITKEEMAEFKENYIPSAPISYQELITNLNELIPMENQKCLIQKIIELKNVNIWHVLYYAYQRTLIDNRFLIDYAIELLSQNKTDDPKIIALAGLLDSEEKEAGKIFESFIAEADKAKILYTESPMLNKIWFYLVLSSEMCSEKIIE